MRLKSIKLAGFKSFVDPTSVHFPSNMCAVVGPNGCGKSNVIDAVRWVMGESSAKNLRGESMADVIFNGSVNRQPVGQATIELVFDNSDGKVGGEYASYAEISIRRLVGREGQSEYFLNGTKCRRRDITDIFLGTGLGPRSYAIIEQGTISRLIESKPEELRTFIEEAAGISKYKERRKETESRMRRTRENLERLIDIRDELQRQLQHLQRQAQSAEKYGVYKEEERELKAQLLAQQWRDLDVRINAITRAVGEAEVRLESVRAEHQSVETAIEKHRVDHSDRTDAFNTAQATYYTLGSEVTRLEQIIKHQQERGRQLNEDLHRTTENLSQAESHLGNDRGKLLSWEGEVDDLSPELEMLKEVELESGDALSSAEEAMNSWQQQWDDFNQHAAEPRQQAEVQQSRIQHLEQVLQRMQKRTTTLQDEKQALTIEPGANEVELLGEQAAELELTMAEYESNGDKLVQELLNTREKAESASVQLNEVRSIVQQLHGRQASLEALQQAAMEENNEGVSHWLEARQLDDKPRLLEQLDVEDGWQLAVETVLGDYLQAVCVDNIGQLGQMLHTLENGQLALVESSSSDNDVPPDSLSSKVSSAGLSNGLLAGVRIADDLAQAMQLRSSLALHESVITREGVWLGANWLRVTRLGDERGGAIARKHELEKLALQLDEKETLALQLSQQLQQASELQRKLEEQGQQCQRDLQGTTREHAQVNAELSARHAKLEQINVRRERVNAEIDEARSQFRNEQEALAQARQILSQAIDAMETDSQQRENLLAQRDQARNILDNARQKARHDKDTAHQLAMRYQSLQTQLESMRESIARTDSQVSQLIERRDSLTASQSENDNPVGDLQAELEEQLDQRLLAESKLSEKRDLVAEVEHKLREAEQNRAAIEQRAQSVRSDLEKERLSNQGLLVQRENIVKQLGESDHKLEDVVEGLPDEATETEWQLKIERVANRISRLGPINLAAIDEYTLQSERKNYLDAQSEDLESALDTLESAIRKIDKETRGRFRETFDKVNAGLQELFPRIFGGGSAYLELTGDDLLNTGITIMARPPGKKNSTIHLLSGGEKALTAIALVFSIFELNPAPFCMLDEVDAPLDDANVARYARMVKEMSDRVQFIFITHNKITMEMADQLMGVTMHEPGVSRLVTVDVEEAAELAAV
jgi:chromosome segregation protein